jgi:hypothetical protein
MLKHTLAVLAIALAGSASAAEWKNLRIDASSESAFEQSLAKFKDKLSPARRYAFGEGLKDIWIKGNQGAEAAQGEYTATDYYREVHGLSYEQVVRFTDPSGDTARDRYRAAPRRQYGSARQPMRTFASSPWPQQPPPRGPTGEHRRGGSWMHPYQQ